MGRAKTAHTRKTPRHASTMSTVTAGTTIMSMCTMKVVDTTTTTMRKSTYIMRGVDMITDINYIMINQKVEVGVKMQRIRVLIKNEK